jgi:hypothetical protein
VIKLLNLEVKNISVTSNSIGDDSTIYNDEDFESNNILLKRFSLQERPRNYAILNKLEMRIARKKSELVI